MDGGERDGKKKEKRRCFTHILFGLLLYTPRVLVCAPPPLPPSAVKRMMGEWEGRQCGGKKVESTMKRGDRERGTRDLEIMSRGGGGGG